MKKYILPFALFWLLDSVVLWVFQMIYPKNIVLGNKSISFLGAIFAAGLVWTLLVWIAGSAYSMYSKSDKRIGMFVFYFLANFAALWITARLAPILGFGVSKFTWLLLITLIADPIQYGIWKVFGFEKRLK